MTKILKENFVFQIIELPAVCRTQPSTKTAHVQLLQWLHGKQQQQNHRTDTFTNGALFLYFFITLFLFRYCDGLVGPRHLVAHPEYLARQNQVRSVFDI